MFAKVLAPIAGAALIAAPALAQSSALSGQPAPAGMERASSAGANANRLEGQSWIPALLAGAIVIAGILLAAGVFDDDDSPVSP